MFGLTRQTLPVDPPPEAESVHSALVSAVSKAKMSDLTESLAPKSIQKALPTE